MRGRNGYVGAVLLYGPQPRPPDLPFVLQCLLEDQRLERRPVSGVQLKGTSLRLRLEGMELVLTRSDTPLPLHAIDRALRPVLARFPRHRAAITAGDAESRTPPTTDLARGRVLHMMRHHHFALSLLLRARNGHFGEDGAEVLLTLTEECRALLEPVIAAAPPRALIWQPGAVAYTCDEFLSLRGADLLLPGDRGNVLHLSDYDPRLRNRPGLFAWEEAPTALATPPDAAPDAAHSDAAPADPLPPGANAQASGTARLPTAALPSRTATSPETDVTIDRPRSAGRLFGTGRTAAPLPRLYRQDARLAQALRRKAPAAARPDHESTNNSAATETPTVISRRLPLMQLAARLVAGLVLLASGALLPLTFGAF